MSRQNLPAPNIYFDHIFSKRAAKIMPGEFFITKRDMIIVSVMGASAITCVHDTKTGLGGMAHIVLPTQHTELSGKYYNRAQGIANDAVVALTRKILIAGAKLENIEAKIFSGPCATGKHGLVDTLGIEEVFQKFKLTPILHALRTVPTNKIYFFPKTGKVLVKKLHTLKNTTVSNRQKTYIQSVILNKYNGK